MRYEAAFHHAVQAVKSEGRYRVFAELKRDVFDLSMGAKPSCSFSRVSSFLGHVDDVLATRYAV